MRFFQSLVLTASALVALVSAASNVQFTDAPNGNAEAGKTYTLKWSGDTAAPATILLKTGPSSALTTVDTVATGVTGGSFKWTVPKDIAPGGSYALQITAGGEPNYWLIGAIAGGTAPTSTNSASSASSSASSVSSALSSASSKIASLTSKLSSATASTSAGTTTPTASRNSTSVTTPSLTRTTGTNTATDTSTSSSSSSTTAPSDNGNSAAGLKSNAALVLGAVAAIAYLG